MNSTAAPARRRSSLTLVGIGLLVAGLACLSWVGFQYVGTNVVSERTLQSETEQLRARWQEPPPGPKDKAQTSEVPGDAIALLRIPEFGDDYEVPILSGTDLSSLNKGVGHYTSTAPPGQIGNFAIAAHRVTHGQPFAKLLQPEQGDEVIVETRDAVYTFVMDDSPRERPAPPPVRVCHHMTANAGVRVDPGTRYSSRDEKRGRVRGGARVAGRERHPGA